MCLLYVYLEGIRGRKILDLYGIGFTLTAAKNYLFQQVFLSIHLASF